MRCAICGAVLPLEAPRCALCRTHATAAERASAFRIIDPAHHWTAQLGADRERAVLALERIRLGVAGLDVDLETKMPLIRTVSAVCEAPDASTARERFRQLTMRLAGSAPLPEHLDPSIRFVEELLRR